MPVKSLPCKVKNRWFNEQIIFSFTHCLIAFNLVCSRVTFFIEAVPMSFYNEGTGLPWHDSCTSH